MTYQNSDLSQKLLSGKKPNKMEKRKKGKIEKKKKKIMNKKKYIKKLNKKYYSCNLTRLKPFTLQICR